MKNKEKREGKKFDTVKFFRTVKDKISKETEGMSFIEFKEYIRKRDNFAFRLVMT